MSQTARRNVVESVAGPVGDTPLLRLDGIVKNRLGKVEAAATEYAAEHPAETTVVVFPDTVERYLSTDLVDEP